jgi:hypothetical protein
MKKFKFPEAIEKKKTFLGSKATEDKIKHF